MLVILLGLGYLLLAALGAACWAIAGGGPRRGSDAAPSRRRRTSVVLAGALIALAARVLVTVLLAQADAAFAQEKALIGLPVSLAASVLAALLWWMPRRSASDPALRDAATTGAFAAATAAALVEILLVIAVGAPAGWLAAAASLAVVAGVGVITALVRTAPSRRARRPVFAAGAATLAVLAGVGAVAVAGSVGDGSLQRAGFGPVSAHGHGTDDAVTAAAAGSDITTLTTAPHLGADVGDTLEVALSAQQQRVELPSGRSIDAWTFGALAGPAIVAQVGDTLSIQLTNADVQAGATVHWHGFPVANAFDGVAGVTQDAVRPGGRYRAEIAMTRPGTYWYHTHQRGSEGVVRGLYGTLIVQPEGGPTEDVDLTLPIHTFSGSVVTGTSDVLEEHVVAPGRTVRLRLINTDQTPQTLLVQGAAFRVVALDAVDVRSAALRDRSLVSPAGGRIDVVVDMPDSAVRVAVAGDRSGGLGLVPRGGAVIPPLAPAGVAFDPLTDLADVQAAASPALTEAGAEIDRALAGDRFEVERTVVLDRLPRLVQALPGYAYTVDGRVYPYIEPTVVDEGDTVRMRLVNRSFETHPMHPHGHTVRVLSVDGRVPEQPLWLDTFDVRPGEVWEVALFADNPGIWMDHCHNLEHAALGMVTHLAYRGVTTPFEHGGPAANAPE